MSEVLHPTKLRRVHPNANLNPNANPIPNPNPNPNPSPNPNPTLDERGLEPELRPEESPQPHRGAGPGAGQQPKEPKRSEIRAQRADPGEASGLRALVAAFLRPGIRRTRDVKPRHGCRGACSGI